jgi:hypothetical protein
MHGPIRSKQILTQHLPGASPDPSYDISPQTGSAMLQAHLSLPVNGAY